MDRSQRLRDGLNEALQDFAADQDPLQALEDLRVITEFVDDYSQARVDDARAGGASWAQIAAALGVTRQAAHKRFGSRRAGKRSLELRLVFEKKPK